MTRIAKTTLFLTLLLAAAVAPALDLAEFVGLVDIHSRELSLARLDGRNADAEKMAATAAALPRVTADAAYGREFLDPPTVPFDNQFQVGASLSQNLLDLRSFYAIRATTSLNRATASQTEATRQAVINQARKAYYRTLLVRAIRDVSRDSESSAHDNYETVRIRFEIGAASEFELLQAEAAYLSTVPERLRAERDYQLAVNGLKVLAGIPLADEVELEGALEEPSGTVVAGGGPDDALRGSPALEALEWQRELYALNLKATEALRYPTLAARVGYSIAAGSDNFAWENDADSLSLGLALSVPIFTGGAAAAAVAKAGIELERAGLRVDQKRDDLLVDSRNIMLRLEEAAKSVEAVSRSAQSARRAYEIAETRVENGLATQLELKESRISYDRARLAYHSAVYDLLAARFDWELVTGTVPK